MPTHCPPEIITLIQGYANPLLRNLKTLIWAQRCLNVLLFLIPVFWCYFQSHVKFTNVPCFTFFTGALAHWFYSLHTIARTYLRRVDGLLAFYVLMGLDL